MTVQDTNEDSLDRQSVFSRRHTSPVNSLWEGKDVQPDDGKKLKKSVSHYINPIYSKNECYRHEKHPLSARSISKKKDGQTDLSGLEIQGTLGISSKGYVASSDTVNRNSLSLDFGNGIVVPYALKESSANRQLQKYLLKEIKLIDDKFDVHHFEDAFICTCLESVDDIFGHAKNQSVNDLGNLLELSVKEAQSRIFSRGLVLKPITDRLTWLFGKAKDYICNELKVRTMWSDELLKELSNINEYLDDQRDCIEGENRIHFFLHFLDKTVRDSVVYGIISKAIQPRKQKTSKLLKLLSLWKLNSIQPIVRAYVFQRAELMQKISGEYLWLESDTSSCKLQHVNRGGMASSLMRDFVNEHSTFTVNGQLIDVHGILSLESEEDRRKMFFYEIAKKILVDEEKANEAVQGIIEQEPSIIDPVLWSCCFHAWSNAELLLQEKFFELTKERYFVHKGLATDCVVDVDKDVQSFDVNIRKPYSIYVCDKQTGIKDETQPIIHFTCSWDYRPQLVDEHQKWQGCMKLPEFQFAKGSSLPHREKVNEIILRIFD
jgi:hypothetical protein